MDHTGTILPMPHSKGTAKSQRRGTVTVHTTWCRSQTPSTTGSTINKQLEKQVSYSMSQCTVLQRSDHRCVQTDMGLKYGNTFVKVYSIF